MSTEDATAYAYATPATAIRRPEDTRSHLINGEAQKIAASILSDLSPVALAKGEARDLLGCEVFLKLLLVPWNRTNLTVPSRYHSVFPVVSVVETHHNEPPRTPGTPSQ